MRRTWVYVVNDWRKTRCPIDCEESSHFGPACPHQRWFPIPHNVQITRENRGGETVEVRCSCTEGKKAGGDRCRQWDEEENCCPHIQLVRDVLDGTAEEREKGRAELSNIHTELPRKPSCPNCGDRWCVEVADGAAKGRWKRVHKKALKNGTLEMPETLWMCRHPNCQDTAGRPWSFTEGTEDRPKGDRRHALVIDERLW